MGNEKTVKVENKSPTDSEGWKKAIDREELDQYCVQDIVRAARNINISGDRTILVALMTYISDQMIGVLSATIGTNQPNRSDMIHDVQHDMICAVLDPDSKDGTALCEAFVPRIRFRALDAIKKETTCRDRYTCPSIIPDSTFEDKSRCMSDQDHEDLHVEQVLNLIPDRMKRLAFRLYVEEIPIESGKGLPSISVAVGKSEKTVRTWIKEIKALLQAKTGENHE